MWNQFVFQNLHFAVGIFASLSLFSVMWLYYDAWTERKIFREAIKILGFLLLSVSFLASAVYPSDYPLFLNLIKSLGYILLVSSLTLEPIEKRPNSTISTGIASAFLIDISFAWSAPILSLLISLLYLRKATIGLENHLKRIALSFFALTLFEVGNLVITIYSSTQNIDIYNLVRPFGPVWIVTHAFLAVFSVLTISWAFSYLLKRINTQLFIIFISSIITIFIVTAVSFSFLLLKNMVDETLNRLSTDTSVLSFAIDAKKKEAMSISLAISKDPRIVDALNSNDRNILGDIAEEGITTYLVSSLTIVDSNSVVVARGEDRARTGDSLSDDLIIKRTLSGEMQSSLFIKQGMISPNIFVRSTHPIKDGDKYIGTVVTSIVLDNTFLDGIKKSTGLDAGIYGDNILSATTVVSDGNKSRPVGIKETNKKILENVLGKGEALSMQTKVLDTDYLASFHPLLDVNDLPIGMIFVGKPSYSTLMTVDNSVRDTFLITIILVIFSIIPSYIISKYITNQLN